MVCVMALSKTHSPSDISARCIEDMTSGQALCNQLFRAARLETSILAEQLKSENAESQHVRLNQMVS